MNNCNSFSLTNRQQNYWQVIKALIQVLQKRLIRFYQGKSCNEYKFFDIVHKIMKMISQHQSKQNIENKFSNLLDPLLDLSIPYQSQRISRISSMSHISRCFDDGISRVSDFSQIGHLPTRKFTIKTEQSDAFEGFKRKKYRSHETVEPASIIEQRVELNKKNRAISSKLKLPEFKSIKSRLYAPRIDPFLKKLKQQPVLPPSNNKKTDKKQVGDPYLGQRRRKQKRIVRNMIVAK